MKKNANNCNGLTSGEILHLMLVGGSTGRQVFKQNSLNLETLIRISAYLNCDFLKDISGICKKYNL